MKVHFGYLFDPRGPYQVFGSFNHDSVHSGESAEFN